MVVRGIFTSRDSEQNWFYQNGTNQLFPEQYECFASLIPAVERNDLLMAYHRRLTDVTLPYATRVELAHAWLKYENILSYFYISPDGLEASKDDDASALQFALIEAHYFVHGAFLSYERELIDGAGSVLQQHSIPGTIINGRYDLCCPPKNAYELKKVWKSADLVFVSDAGHSVSHSGITDQLIRALIKYEKL